MGESFGMYIVGSDVVCGFVKHADDGQGCFKPKYLYRS